MNNFEKRMFAAYAEKLIYFTNVETHSFDEIFDFLIGEFKLNKKNYKYDRYKNLKVDTKAEKNEFIKTFLKEIKDYAKNLKPRNTLFEKQCKIIKDLFRLNADEYQIFLYFAIRETNNIIAGFFDCLYDNSFETFATEYLKLRTGKRERILTDLNQRNIIVYKRRSDYSVNSLMLRIFDSKTCNTAEKIMNVLLGKKEHSGLKLSDYDHL